MRTVILDLDGTLADTSADLLAAANAQFVKRGLGGPLDPQADRLTAFHGGRAMLRLGYERLGLAPDTDTADRDYHALLADYADGIDRETRLYPGAAEAVETLRSQGFAVGICTNKPVDLAEALIRRLGVRDLFASLVGAGSFPVRKPDPLPYVASVEQAGGSVARSFLVGDTETDRLTARAAGVPAVLVTFGPEGRGIERLQAEAYLESFADLADIAICLLGRD